MGKVVTHRGIYFADGCLQLVLLCTLVHDTTEEEGQRLDGGREGGREGGRTRKRKSEVALFVEKELWSGAALDSH